MKAVLEAKMLKNAESAKKSILKEAKNKVMGSARKLKRRQKDEDRESSSNSTRSQQ